MGTVAVMGDIGGQMRVFYDALRHLGISEDLRLPDGLTVINVGDIARMSDSSNLHSLACVELADKLIQRNEGRWIQLLGNHESPFIGGPALEEWFDLDHFEESQKIVSRWWNEGQAQLGQVIETTDSGKDIVITHAGLTSGFMKNNDFESDHRGMVSFLNSLADGTAKSYADIAAVGAVVFGKVSSNSVDCLWAATSAELYPSWDDEKMGFHQIHGHDVPLYWEPLRFRGDVTPQMKNRLKVDETRRQVRYQVPSGEFIDGIDWVLKNKVHLDSETWEMKFLNDAVLCNPR